MKKKIKIGILGGSFDPAHKGHLAISKEAKKRFNLKKIIWAITKKNPFKDESKTTLSKRIKDCKKIIGLNPFIKVKFYEDIIKSNKTIDLINYLKKNNGIEIYFLMGKLDFIIFLHPFILSLTFVLLCFFKGFFFVIAHIIFLSLNFFNASFEIAKWPE